MANYEYLGCVTGFSEAGNTQLIQPTDTPMPVTRASNAYTERLLGVGLLLSDDENSGQDDSGFNWLSLAVNNTVALDGMSDGINFFEAYINGVAYNKDYADYDLGNALWGLDLMGIDAGRDNLWFTNLTQEVLNVKLVASAQQAEYTTQFLQGEGLVLEGNVFLFRLAAASSPATRLIDINT